jgi:hypothetical protein
MHVRLLWRRHGRGAGPDALVIGDYGGSGGNGDVFAVTVRASSTVAKYRGERLDGVRAERQAALHLNFPLDIEYFNGAPHAGAAIVPIPTAWKDGNFAADLPALVRPIPKQELGFRELAVEEELRSWAEESYPASRLYPPQARTGTLITVQALTELMLSGHADEAKALLSRSWPTSFSRSDVKLGGEEDFWRDLCRRVVEHPLWKRLGLSRLPHADVIRAGAR